MDARSELLNMVYPAIAQRIEAGDRFTPEVLREHIKRFVEPLKMLNASIEITEEDVEVAARKIETLIDVQLDESVYIEKGYEAWLDQRRAEIDPYYWDRYRDWLRQQGLPPAVVAEMGASTDRVLDLLRDPNSLGSWDRRGLVMGHVQSGKTAHYTGLVCKAADAGFKVIIVIAGVHNNLRNQTQRRLDQGFIGEHRTRELTSVRRERIGVGKISHERRPVGFTSSHQDFTKATADAMGVSFSALSEPAIFVIKKNPTTLRRLIEWLKPVAGDAMDDTLLLIDDEADNASINVAYSKSEISTINDLLRRLLKMFNRSAYVGYTATPFANIFIDPTSSDEMVADDLFPRSFIFGLDAPTDYFGARQVFQDDSQSFLRWIDDSEDLIPVRHKKRHIIPALPESLSNAVRCFVLTRAVRILRGDGQEHSSMLINASRFVDVQHDLKALVVRQMEQIRDSARLFHALPVEQADTDLEIKRLHQQFDSEFGRVEFSWAEVLPQLWTAAAPIRIVAINNKSADALNYSEHSTGLHVIAVGGLSLSRGLTLEGLSTSYFLRNSQMYDTLMQMARWFGYRPGYEDLCRIWMTEEVAGWYTHIAESVDELRVQLKQMASDGRSPEEFGLKVRAHPASLIVTARNRMGAGESRTLQIGLAQRNIQTHALSNQDREHNIAAGNAFMSALSNAGYGWEKRKQVPGGFLIKDVPIDLVCAFIAAYRNSTRSLLTDTEAVLRYIGGRPEEMQSWDVFVAHRREPSPAGTSSVLGPVINLRTRTVDVQGSTVEFRQANFLDPSDEKAGLSQSEIETAEQAYRDENRPGRDGKYNYPARAYRSHRKRPQLGLHLLSLSGATSLGDEPWLAWNISFPKTSAPNETTAYVVNAVWLDEFIESEGDGDEYGD